MQNMKDINSHNLFSNRQTWLDSCKGFAIILVVLGHIFDGYLGAGIFTEYFDKMTTGFNIIYSFHMALFYMISGFVFFKAYCSSKENNEARFKVQVRNLIWIYILFSVIQWIFKMLAASYVNYKVTVWDLLGIIIKPMAPYWYLWVLVVFYIFCFVSFRIFKNYILLFILTIFVGLGSSFIKLTYDYPVRGCTYFITAFAIGTLIASYSNEHWRKWYFLVLFGTISAVTIVYIVLSGHAVHYIPIISLVVSISLAYSIFTIFNVTAFASKIPILPILGRYSLEIYVTHCFITAGNRKILLAIGLQNYYINVCINLIMATFVPVFCAWILKKINLHKVIFKPFSLEKN